MSVKEETVVYYRVRFTFRHDTRYYRAGETRYVVLWPGMEGNCKWLLNTKTPLFAHRFETKKAAQEAASSFRREDYGGDACCERVIERVTEVVARSGRVPAPPPVIPRQKLVSSRSTSCDECRPVGSAR